MKPLRGCDWSGRIQSFTPPARSFWKAAIWLIIGFASAVHSATNIVTSLADNGAGSLRQVIQDSAPGDSIVFGVTGVIVLTNGELVVAKNFTICGPGVSALVISGNHASRVLNINAASTVFISNLAFWGGRAVAGTDGRTAHEPRLTGA